MSRCCLAAGTAEEAEVRQHLWRCESRQDQAQQIVSRLRKGLPSVLTDQIEKQRQQEMLSSCFTLMHLGAAVGTKLMSARKQVDNLDETKCSASASSRVKRPAGVCAQFQQWNCNLGDKPQLFNFDVVKCSKM